MASTFFLGIDQSFTSTGLVILDSDSRVMHVERVVSDSSHDIYERAWEIGTAVVNLINSHPDCIINVAIEGIAFGRMIGNATRDLAGLQFVVINMIRHMTSVKSVAIISPKEVKKIATNSGKADKKQMIESLPPDVLEIFLQAGMKKTKGLPDVADAYWIATILSRQLQNKKV